MAQKQDRLTELARQVWLSKAYPGAKRRLSNVVVKLTRDCNLRCVYCYVCGGISSEKTDPEMVVRFFDDAAINNPSIIRVSFHGGEPLLAGDELKNIVNVLESRPYAPRLEFSIQTNATLVNEAWVHYFKEHNFTLGVSLDGLEEANDAIRVNVGGQGSFKQTLRGIRMIRNSGLRVGIILVVTKTNQHRLIEFLEFCRDEGIGSVTFAPYFPAGYGLGKEEQLQADNEEYWLHTKEVIEWLVKHNQSNPNTPIYEREISSITQNIVIPNNGCYMCASSPCGAGTRHVGLDTNGDVYLCDTLYGIQEYVIGNYLKEDFNLILGNPKIQKFSQRSLEQVPKCSTCSLKTWCYGGCPAHNFFFYGEEGFTKESHMCEWYMQIIPYLKDHFASGEIIPQLLVSDLGKIR